MYKLFVLCMFLTTSTSALAIDALEQKVRIPVTVKTVTESVQIQLEAMEYRPVGNGPFPVLVISHGSPRKSGDRARMRSDGYAMQARLFVQRGFVVLEPMRRGYGKSDGPANDITNSCGNPGYFDAGLRAAEDVQASLNFARTLPYVDPDRMVLLGKSAGGFASLALASLNPPGVVGTINFAGGRGSRGPDRVCSEAQLVDAFSRYASTTHTPMLWFYSQNDHFFGPQLAARMADAYQQQKVDLRFVAAPPYGNDGHHFFEGAENVSLWMPEVDTFLHKLGFTVSPK